MLRYVIALALLVGAVLLIGAAGGIEVLSPDDWKAVTQKWALPATADTERCLTLLVGGIVALLALARLLSPLDRPVRASASN